MDKLVREFIEEWLLNEEDSGYGDYGFDSSSPWGLGVGGPSLKQIFVEPFTDVLKTAKAGVEKTAASARTALKVGIEAALTTFIPILGSDFKEIFDNEKEELRKIKEKYRDVFARTDKAFENDDFLATSFLLSPTAFITKRMIEKSPAVVMDVLNTLAGSDPGLLKYLKNLSVTFKDALGKGHSTKKDYAVWHDSVSAKAVLTEEQANRTDELMKKLLNPQFITALKSTQISKEMRDDARKLMTGTVNDLLGKVNEIKSLNSLQQAKDLYPGLDLSKLNSVPEDQRKAAESQLLTALKSAGINFYKQNIAKQLEHLTKSGVQKDHPMAVAYRKLLDMLK